MWAPPLLVFTTGSWFLHAGGAGAERWALGAAERGLDKPLGTQVLWPLALNTDY